MLRYIDSVKGYIREISVAMFLQIQADIYTLEKICNYIIIYVYLCRFHTRCLYCNYSPSPPKKLLTSQSLPPSSASSVMIKSHSIDLAGLAHRKNSLTLHRFLT